MRALLIDPEARTVTEIDHPGTRQTLYETIGCTVVERVALLPGEWLWTDEEGLLKDKPGPFFQIGDNIPIAGKSICFGENRDGDPAASHLDLAVLQGAVTFPCIELIGWDELDGSTMQDTVMGPMPVYGITPVFATKTCNGAS